MALTKAKFGVISSALASGNATDGYVLTADGSGNSAWEEASGGVAGISSSADATAITINSSEQVAIGITTPTADLTLPSRAYNDSGAAGASGIRFTDGGDGTADAILQSIRVGNDGAHMFVGANSYVATSGSVAQFDNTENSSYVDCNAYIGSVVFGTGEAGSSLSERMRLDSSGRFFIGKTTLNQTTTTGHTFLTSGTVYRTDFNVSNNEFMIFNNHSSPAGTASLQFRYDNSAKGSIGLTSTAVSFNTSSDYRLKENIDYSWDATARLKQLKPARFNWISDDTNTLVDGFIAHEVSDIVPEAITGEKDATKTLSNVVLDSNNLIIGEDVSEDDWTAGKTGDDPLYPSDSTWEASHTVPVYQEIDQAKLVPLLVKTIQELETRIETLENA